MHYLRGRLFFPSIYSSTALPIVHEKLSLRSFPFPLGEPLWLPHPWLRADEMLRLFLLGCSSLEPGQSLWGNWGFLCFGSSILPVQLTPIHGSVSLHLGSLTRFSKFELSLLFWESFDVIIVESIGLGLVASCPCQTENTLKVGAVSWLCISQLTQYLALGMHWISTCQGNESCEDQKSRHSSAADEGKNLVL